MHVLVTGALGRLGSKIAALLVEADHPVTGVDVDSFDLTDSKATREAIELAHPDSIIHCAALTNVDQCARKPDLALKVNAFGTHNVAVNAQRLGIPMMLISTNEVFDGTAEKPYLEYDRTNPINPYGYSKWVAEEIVRDLVPAHTIIRTSWLFAHGGRNFIQAILERAKEGKPLRVVTDEIACPTYNDDLAQAVIEMAERQAYGTYHLVNEGAASRYEMAREILDRAGFGETPIEPILLKDYERDSTPPPYAPLRNFFAAQMGVKLRSWQDALAAFMKKEAASRDESAAS
jgi:dTDP-4-dehydrorhamnose reductase